MAVRTGRPPTWPGGGSVGVMSGERDRRHERFEEAVRHGVKDFDAWKAERARLCPHCGCEKLFGPAIIITVDDGEEHAYYDCARCHTLCLVVDGKLEARAGAW